MEGARPEGIQVNQDILRAKVEEMKPPVGEYFKRPYVVWKGLPGEFEEGKDLSAQESVPAIMRKVGPADGTSYSSEQLNKSYRNGGLIIQPNGKGGIEIYPMTAKGIDMNTTLPSQQQALDLNPELSTLLENDPEMKSFLDGGQAIGMMRSAPAQMIKMSDIGYPLEVEVVLPGKGAGQRKHAGEEAYLGIGKNKEGKDVYWIINADTTGRPVNYMTSEDVKAASEGN